MFDFLDQWLENFLKSLALESYGWQSRKYKSMGKAIIEWRDPHSLQWYNQSTALSLMKVQAMRDVTGQK